MTDADSKTVGQCGAACKWGWDCQLWCASDGRAELTQAVADQKDAPRGFVLVPREPRPELVAAFWRSKNAGESDYDAYRAMVRAAEGER